MGRTKDGAAQIAQAGTNGRIVAAYLEALDARPATRETYRRNLRPFVAWLEAEGLRIPETRREHILAYRAHLQETHRPGGVNAYLAAVRGLYRWLASETGYPDVARDVRGMRAGAGVSTAREALTVEEARRVAAHLDGAGLQALRDRAMVNTMLRCGLRTVEIVRADVGDLRREGTRTVLWVHGKGRDEADELVVLDRAALAPITAYLQARGAVSDHEPLFAGVGSRNAGGRLSTRTVRKAAKHAMQAEGIDGERYTAHSLRHTCLTLAIEGGASLLEAQALARHADPRTTERYLHRLERLRGAGEARVSAMLEG